MWSHLWDWLRADTTKFSSSFIDDPISTIKGDNEDAALAAAYSMSPRDTHYITPLINILTDGSAKTWLESVNEFNKPPGITTPSVHASYALSVIGEPALMELIDVLENSDENERILAAQTLADMGLRAKEAVPALCKAIKDQSKDVRAQAAEGLGQISQGTGDAIPSLIDALGDSSEDESQIVLKDRVTQWTRGKKRPWLVDVEADEKVNYGFIVPVIARLKELDVSMNLVIRPKPK